MHKCMAIAGYICTRINKVTWQSSKNTLRTNLKLFNATSYNTVSLFSCSLTFSKDACRSVAIG